LAETGKAHTYQTFTTNLKRLLMTIQQNGLDAHWDKIHTHQESDFRSSNLNNMVLRFIPENGKVLDIGCGTCAQTMKLIKKGYDVQAIDSSETMVENAKRLLREAGFSPDIAQHKDLFEMSTHEKFDIIICLDVLEHIEDDLNAFRCICNLLKEGGWILISVPAMQSLFSYRDEEIGHFRRYNKPMVLKLFDNCNIKVEKIKYWNFIGILPLLISLKMKKRVNEEFRYKKNLKSRLINKILYYWFNIIENNIGIGVGLTLFCLGRKR
jgi:2-polyprenyl-3-methyl-5-hydroxy-6-metoxy-1,4-benzoquinol methylase